MNKKPNILWILAEDIGCHQGCFGHTNAKTPNIDIFAKEGVRLQNSYKKRGDKPFFMMHTILCTHQSQYGYSNTASEHRTSMPRICENDYCDRDSVVVPKYHYDTPATREIWAQYHEKMTTMDKMFYDKLCYGSLCLDECRKCKNGDYRQYKCG